MSCTFSNVLDSSTTKKAAALSFRQPKKNSTPTMFFNSVWKQHIHVLSRPSLDTQDAHQETNKFEQVDQPLRTTVFVHQLTIYDMRKRLPTH